MQDALLPPVRDQTGFCYSRKNLAGKLYSLHCGLSTAFAIDPIESKPLLAHWLAGLPKSVDPPLTVREF
jgi:hypothetical protein